MKRFWPYRLGLLAAILGMAGCADSPVPLEKPEEGFVEARDGTRLYYKWVGEGSDTVMVPLAYWNQEGFERLADGHAFLFYDPRGRRRSDAVTDSTQFGLEQDLRDLEAVRRHFGIAQMALVGTSYYGALVARYAMLHPEHVTRLIMVGSLYLRRTPHIAYDPPEAAGRWDSTAARRLGEMEAAGADTLDPEAYCEAYWEVQGPLTVGDPAFSARREYPCDIPNEWPSNTSRWGAGVFRSLGEWDWREEAARLKTPALIIHGESDLMVPRAAAEEWARVLPNGYLLLLPGAGHVPWWEYEEVIFPAIDQFLKGVIPQNAHALP